MRKKIKQVLCMFSALVVMICCAVPAFADDVSGGGSSSNVIRVKRFSQMIDYAKNNNIDIENSHYIMTYSEDSSQYYWWYYIFFIPDDILVNDTLILTHGRYSSSFTNSFIKARVSDYGNSDIDDLEYCANVDVSSFSLYVDDDEQSHSYPNHIFKSNIKITNNGDDITPTDPNAVPAPFSVTYSPDLKLNLKRKTSDYETKSIDVTLTLNQDYLDWYIRRYAEMKLNVEVGKLDSESIEAILGTKNLAEVFDLTGCGKSKCIYFISLSDPSKPLRTVTQNSVYTYLSQQRYSIVDKDNGDIDGSTSTAVYANGLYPYFTVDFKEYFKHTMQSDIVSENCSYKKYQAVIKNLPTYQLSIPLENIDAEKFEVISVLNSILTCETLFPTESGQSVFDGSFKSAYSVDRGPNGVNFNNIDYINVDKWDTDDTGYLDYFSKSDCYSVYTAQFSFDSYPKYVPLKDGKGNDIDMIKTNPFDYSMHPVKPGTYQSVNKDGTLSEERTLEEQKKHDKDNTFSKNFASVDYTDFSSIFSTSSSYFEFLTASIRILPDWFIATFTAWFVTFLTLALIKYVIQ
ncbi:MAG: hypothetical protein ACLT32_00805 [Ruminococcus bicirculans (ex Wegman et al. 2014)]|uniref:hypothetical protein n=2 Tax=Ruminococcus TaxID=1263 RepID=UPI0039935370